MDGPLLALTFFLCVSFHFLQFPVISSPFNFLSFPLHFLSFPFPPFLFISFSLLSFPLISFRFLSSSLNLKSIVIAFMCCICTGSPPSYLSRTLLIALFPMQQILKSIVKEKEVNFKFFSRKYLPEFRVFSQVLFMMMRLLRSAIYVRH